MDLTFAAMNLHKLLRILPLKEKQRGNICRNRLINSISNKTVASIKVEHYLSYFMDNYHHIILGRLEISDA